MPKAKKRTAPRKASKRRSVTPKPGQPGYLRHRKEHEPKPVETPISPEAVCTVLKGGAFLCPEATAKQVLAAIDDWFFAGTYNGGATHKDYFDRQRERSALWDVFSALRGPDGKSGLNDAGLRRDKNLTTAIVRAQALPKSAKFVGGLTNYTGSLEDARTAALSSRPKDMEFWDDHFGNHIRSAVDALEAK